MGNNIQPAYGLNVSTKSFAKQIFSDKDFVKEASLATTMFVQDKIRENGFARKVINTIPVSESQLIETEETDQPVIMGYRDVDTRAFTVPLRGRGTYHYYETEKFKVYFEKVVSEKIRKSKIEMMNSSIDYKSIFQRRITEAMYKVEDLTVMAGANKALAEEKAAAATAGAVKTTDEYTKTSQSIEFKDGITLNKDSLVTFLQMPTQNQMEVKKILMTASMKEELIRMSMLEVGDSNVADMWKNGVNSIQSFWGKDIVTTIKNDVVADNEVYAFGGQGTEGSLYGWLFILRDHTVYLETDRDMLTIDSDAYLAHAIGNTKGVYKATYAI